MSDTPDLKPSTRVRASADGLAAFPDLQFRLGRVQWSRWGKTCVVWDDRDVTTTIPTTCLDIAENIGQVK